MGTTAGASGNRVKAISGLEGMITMTSRRRDGIYYLIQPDVGLPQWFNSKDVQTLREAVINPDQTIDYGDA